MVEPTTFTTDRTRAPLRLASRRAARVSMVSPDWLMTSARVRLLTMGSQYRNSEARATSTGLRSSFSRMYLAATPTW